MCDAVEGGVIGRFRVFVLLAGLLVAAYQKDGVVGSGRDGQGRQQGDGEGREVDHPEVAQQGDGPSRGAHLDADDGEDEQHRADRTVDQQQHDRDHDHGDHRHLDHALVAGLQ